MNKVSSKKLDYFHIYTDKKKGYFYYSKFRKKGFLLPKDKLKEFMFIQSRHYMLLLMALVLMNYFKINMLEISVLFSLAFLFLETMFNFVYLKSFKSFKPIAKNLHSSEIGVFEEKYSTVLKTLFLLIIGVISTILVFLFDFTKNERVIILILSAYTVYLSLKSIFKIVRSNNEIE